MTQHVMVISSPMTNGLQVYNVHKKMETLFKEKCSLLKEGAGDFSLVQEMVDRSLSVCGRKRACDAGSDLHFKCKPLLL